MQPLSSPYQHCPVIRGERLTLRLVRPADAGDLLRCYADPQAQALFNADNCTNAFCYNTLAEMQVAIAFWLAEYDRGYYVRFAVVDAPADAVIGTIEMFTRPANDGQTILGLLRLDLQSAEEREATMNELLDLIETHFPRYFAYDALVTKIVPAATVRAALFQQRGFRRVSGNSLVSFEEYYIRPVLTRF